MRRRIREAYRLNRSLISPDLPADLAFIYVADKLLPYAKVENALMGVWAYVKPAGEVK